MTPFCITTIHDTMRVKLHINQNQEEQNIKETIMDPQCELNYISIRTKQKQNIKETIMDPKRSFVK